MNSSLLDAGFFKGLDLDRHVWQAEPPALGRGLQHEMIQWFKLRCARKGGASTSSESLRHAANGWCLHCCIVHCSVEGSTGKS